MEHSRVYAKIDLDAVEENFASMRENIKPGTQIAAVIKADGYGHGAVSIARLVEPYSYIWGFAVATVEEGLALREAGIQKPILLLGFAFPGHYRDIAETQIRPAVFKEDMACQLSDAAVRTGHTIPCHLAVDTGMTRIGFPDTEESVEAVRRITGLPGLEWEGVFTHFARADEVSLEPARIQLARFQDFSSKLEAAGIHIPLKHCSNSAAIMQFREADLDMVRAGISLYGLLPSDEVQREPVRLRAAMEIKSHITYVKWVEPGVAVSYGGTFVTGRPTRIATIPVGYADGYPRSLSNKGQVLIRGKRAPILGRICMDQFMVDITDIPEAGEFDEVTLLGQDGEECLSAEELGSLSGRFNYELVCDINKRVPRLYLHHGKIVEERRYYTRG